MNRFTNHLLFVALFFAAISGCKDNAGNNQGTDGTDSVDTDTSEIGMIEYTPYSHSGAECDNLQPYEFCFEGFSFIRLGDTVAWKELAIPAGTVKDTVFEEIQFAESGPDTTSWVVRMIEETDGRIYLETDFETNWTLNRARIESEKFILKPFGLHVGMTVADLKKSFPNLFVGPLPDYKMIEIYPSNRLYFLIEDKGYLEGVAGIPGMEVIPDDAVIKSIVLM